jgi:hypothetical protein
MHACHRYYRGKATKVNRRMSCSAVRRLLVDFPGLPGGAAHLVARAAVPTAHMHVCN